MVHSFHFGSVLDGLSARLVLPAHTLPPLSAPHLTNWANTYRTVSFSFAFLDPLFPTDLATVDSVFSKNVTGEGDCLATTVTEYIAASLSCSVMCMTL